MLRSRLRWAASWGSGVLWVVVGVVVVVVLAATWAVLLYNRLVANRNRVEEAWSGIDVQLQRRADLVPNLVETVQGYRIHEQDVLTEVAEARSRVVAAAGPRESGEADDHLEQTLRSLFAVAEAYPDLKASTNFLQLQHDLASLEEEISFARRYYNAVVQRLNTMIESFPAVLLARPMGFSEAEYFKAEASDRAVPQVEG